MANQFNPVEGKCDENHATDISNEYGEIEFCKRGEDCYLTLDGATTSDSKKISQGLFDALKKEFCPEG